MGRRELRSSTIIPSQSYKHLKDMRVLSILPLIASLYTTGAHVAGALTPAPPPTFETLFVGQFTAGDLRVINNGTFGTRLHAPIIGYVASEGGQSMDYLTDLTL